MRRAIGIVKRLNSRVECDNKHFKSQARDNRVVKRQVRAGQPECERKKWPSWLMRAARGVAWRAVIRIVIRLIHSGREVGKSAAAAAGGGGGSGSLARGAPRRPVGTLTSRALCCTVRAARRNYLLTRLSPPSESRSESLITTTRKLSVYILCCVIRHALESENFLFFSKCCLILNRTRNLPPKTNQSHLPRLAKWRTFLALKRDGGK